MPQIPRPPAYVAAGLLAQHLLAPERRPQPARIIAGTGIALAGVGLFSAGVLTFRRHRTTVDPIHPENASTVVQDGVFGLTRNPMYVGMTGLLSGHALARGGVLTWLPVAAFVALIDRTQIPAEEQAMRANFGADYDAYVRRVPRWLGPGVTSRAGGSA